MQNKYHEQILVPTALSNIPDTSRGTELGKVNNVHVICMRVYVCIYLHRLIYIYVCVSMFKVTLTVPCMNLIYFCGSNRKVASKHFQSVEFCLQKDVSVSSFTFLYVAILIYWFLGEPTEIYF